MKAHAHPGFRCSAPVKARHLLAAQPLARLPAARSATAQRPVRGHRHARIQAAAGWGQVAEVAELKGVRVLGLDQQGQRPEVQYLVGWKDGAEDTWEPAQNIADNLLRDFEEQWWAACRKGNKDVIRAMMTQGAQVMARTVDANARNALHFLAAVGDPEPVRWLIRAGVDINQGDREGYTPLHMAVGYSRIATVQALIDAGADPERQDKKGRSALQLVDDLRAAMPLSAETMGRRTMLEQVAGVLTENLYEEIEPIAVLDSRKVEGTVEAAQREGGLREFLVRWPDQEEPQWVGQDFLADDVVQDFDAGLEYAEAEAVLRMRQRGDSRWYLVRWGDGYPETWEPEEGVSPDLVRLWEEQEAAAAGTGSNVASGNAQQQQQHHLPQQDREAEQQQESQQRHPAIA